MKILFFLILIVFVSFDCALSQNGWYKQNSGTTEDLVEVFFTDLNNGWAVGTNGIIIHTSDGGENWIKQNSGTTYYLGNVYFIDSTIGWVIGDSSIILKTTDLGENWIKVNTGIIKQFMGIYFINKDTGYVTGENGIIIKTIDGGNKWNILDSGSLDNHLWSIYFIDKNIGVAVGEYGRIIRTSDGGINWTKINDNIGNRKLQVLFYDKKNGWIAGFGGVWVTSNAGLSWEQTFNPGHVIIGDITFTSLYNGWVVTDISALIHSTDAGLHWQEDYILYYPSSYFGIFSIDSNNIWAVGANGIIIHTKNGGVNGLQDDKINNDEIGIFPNPSSSKCTISLPEADRLSGFKLFNYFGEEITNSILNTIISDREIRFDVSSLSKGFYFIFIEMKGKHYSKPLLVNR